MAAKVLVTGCNGLLGTELVNALSAEYDVTGIDLREVDIVDPVVVRSFMQQTRPEIVTHAAAYTDVDGCESNRDLAMSVNGDGTKNVAMACREIGAKLIYFSTDYVFNGKKDSAYLETDKPNPVTIYGQSKLAGERAIADTTDNFVIMRIAWLYGAHGKNFVKTMLRLGQAQIEAKQAGKMTDPLKVVNDQIGNPTWTADIARQIELLIGSDVTGLFHATSEGECSWYEMTRQLFRLRSMDVDLLPCKTEEFPRPAPRPARSSLENQRLKQLDLNRMRPWAEALEEFLRKVEDV
ncbi:MAG: dTDP-4-dehydrorhamnose reductase [candidate division Zixibacteria bacterium]|nr:dTDP-4-dehydrorhamnose reductase [candidate division Zixibacteria bacterium]